LADFRKKVAILKVHDGGHRVLGKNVNIGFQIKNVITFPKMYTFPNLQKL